MSQKTVALPIYLTKDDRDAIHAAASALSKSTASGRLVRDALIEYMVKNRATPISKAIDAKQGGNRRPPRKRASCAAAPPVAASAPPTSTRGRFRCGGHAAHIGSVYGRANRFRMSSTYSLLMSPLSQTPPVVATAIFAVVPDRRNSRERCRRSLAPRNVRLCQRFREWRRMSGLIRRYP